MSNRILDVQFTVFLDLSVCAVSRDSSSAEGARIQCPIYAISNGLKVIGDLQLVNEHLLLRHECKYQQWKNEAIVKTKTRLRKLKVCGNIGLVMCNMQETAEQV